MTERDDGLSMIGGFSLAFFLSALIWLAIGWAVWRLFW